MAKTNHPVPEELAHQMQSSFLPARLPQVPGYTFAAFHKSVPNIGGDFHDFIPLPGDRLAVLVGEAAGKGASAAYLRARVLFDVRVCLLNEPTPADAITRANLLLQEPCGILQFVPLVVCVLDPTQHEVVFVNAGHQMPLLYRRTANVFEEAGPRGFGGLPLGVMDEMAYESCTIPLGPGDALVFLSDGTFAAPSLVGQSFGMQRVYAALQAGPATPEAMIQRLVDAVRNHAIGLQTLHDDLTVVCLARTA